jgi:trk system potassium uptake protein TrkA
MDTVILGCGRVGARVAAVLSQSRSVAIIDWNEAAFERLGQDFAGQTLLGNGIDVDVLRVAGVESSDLFLALTEGDNRNLMAAQIAREIGAKRAIARVYDPVRCTVYGSDTIETVSPTVKGAERLFDLVTAPR